MIDNNGISYTSEVFDCTKNSYRIVNEKYYRIVKEKSEKIFYVPIVRPILDDIDYLEQLVLEMKPVVLKIHGVGSGIDPNMIPIGFSQFVKKHNLMLIVHTDYDDGKNVRYDTLLLRQLNTPYRWESYLVCNQINGVLNHGAALDIETISLANESRYIKIALGPDNIIQHDVHRVYASRKELEKVGYLKLLKTYLLPEKIVFDIDFNWNIDLTTGSMD